MAICPYCSVDVIEGDDHCPECQASLSDLHLPEPSSAVERALLKDRVGELNPNEPLTIAHTATVGEAMRTMSEKHVGCLMVMDDGKLAGIFTERDALMKIGPNVEDRAGQPVAKFMTPAPRTLSASAKVAFAVHRMDLGGFRHLPLVDETGYPVAMISVRDILSYLASLAPPE